MHWYGQDINENQWRFWYCSCRNSFKPQYLSQYLYRSIYWQFINQSLSYSLLQAKGIQKTFWTCCKARLSKNLLGLLQ